MEQRRVHGCLSESPGKVKSFFLFTYSAGKGEGFWELFLLWLKFSKTIVYVLC